MVETRNVSWSVVLHGLILFIAAVGLPILLPKKPDPEPLVMSVELLPISEINNVKPSDQPLQKAQAKPTPTPPKPVPTPPAPTPVKATPTPPAPAPTPPPPKTFDPDEGAAVKDKIKPVEKTPPKPTVDQKANDEFNKILNDLQKEAKDNPAPTTPPAPAATDAKDKTDAPANLTKSDQPYNDAIPMSQTETNSIRDQLQICWSPPIGAKDANKLIVIVHITIGADGAVTDPKLDASQQGRYNSDSFFRAAADAAMRATQNPKCSTLKNLPADKYNHWRQTEVTFDPSGL